MNVMYRIVFLTFLSFASLHFDPLGKMCDVYKIQERWRIRHVSVEVLKFSSFNHKKLENCKEISEKDGEFQNDFTHVTVKK